MPIYNPYTIFSCVHYICTAHICTVHICILICINMHVGIYTHITTYKDNERMHFRFFKKANFYFENKQIFPLAWQLILTLGQNLPVFIFLGWEEAVNAVKLPTGRCFRLRFLFRKANWMQKLWYALEGLGLFSPKLSHTVMFLTTAEQSLGSNCSH